MTAKKQQPKEVEITLEPVLRDSLWKEVLEALRRAKGLQENGILLEAVTLYQIRKYKLHLSIRLSWSQFQKVYEYAKGTVDRYVHAGKFIEDWVTDRYKPTGNDPLLITEEMVSEFVHDRQLNGRSVSLRGITDEIKERNAFLTYLTTGGGLSEAEFAKRMKLPKPPTHKSKPSEPQELPRLENIIPFRQSYNDDLFATHDRIINAGYTYDGNGRYLNQDNEYISVEELSEFTDEKAGMMIFDDAHEVLTPALKELLARIERHRVFYLAYSNKNPSPKFRELAEERHKESEALALAILHAISIMRKKLED
jgi:hypothetical protein